MLCCAATCRAAQDRVANMRFNAAKVLEALAPLADALLIDQTFKPCLTELQARGCTHMPHGTGPWAVLLPWWRRLLPSCHCPAGLWGFGRVLGGWIWRHPSARSWLAQQGVEGPAARVTCLRCPVPRPQTDPDSDVRYFARQALAACDNVTAMS